MMACTRMKIRREFGVLVVRPRGLVEDAFAEAVADNVIGLSGNGLCIKGISSSHL
jgi:hypothetical protein